MHRSRTALAAALIALPLTLAGCSGDEGDVDVQQPGNVEVTPPDADVDAPDADAPDVDADVDVEETEDPDGEAGPDESPSS